ncbi:hypothetical protein DMN91_005688 [Ooceraea biroi]|uniref:Uncharacterized protein n=1 Tax=Ooceraea biroi TaxID=2015173 RepID=A0A3L8DLK7_OOCBI|nr:hypothetical protein DMN91_005688 [Ooceraea biroi]
MPKATAVFSSRGRICPMADIDTPGIDLFFNKRSNSRDVDDPLTQRSTREGVVKLSMISSSYWISTSEMLLSVFMKGVFAFATNGDRKFAKQSSIPFGKLCAAGAKPNEIIVFTKHGASFFSLLSVGRVEEAAGERSAKISRKHLAYPKLKHNEKARVYTPCLIIIVRSTVRAYSEGYAWARTSENVRGREGSKVVMGSIESEGLFDRLHQERA